MPVRLPAHLGARTVPDEGGVTFSRRNNQKSGHGIHSVSQALPPLKNPIDGDGDITRQRRFNMRVYIDEVDRPRARRGDDAKIVALREQGIEGPQRVLSRIVTARDVRLSA